jgi:hypothetical protein
MESGRHFQRAVGWPKRVHHRDRRRRHHVPDRRRRLCHRLLKPLRRRVVECRQRCEPYSRGYYRGYSWVSKGYRFRSGACLLACVCAGARARVCVCLCVGACVFVREAAMCSNAMHAPVVVTSRDSCAYIHIIEREHLEHPLWRAL